jgi:hypothetical protein
MRVWKRDEVVEEGRGCERGMKVWRRVEVVEEGRGAGGKGP